MAMCYPWTRRKGGEGRGRARLCQPIFHPIGSSHVGLQRGRASRCPWEGSSHMWASKGQCGPWHLKPSLCARVLPSSCSCPFLPSLPCLATHPAVLASIHGGPWSSRRICKLDPRLPPAVATTAAGSSGRFAMNRLLPKSTSAALLRCLHLVPLASRSSPLTLRASIHSTALRKHASSKSKQSDPVSDVDPTKPADFDPSNFDPTECRSPPSQKVLRIVDEIANLTLLEASDLSHLLKKKLGLPDGAMPYYGGGMSPGMAMPQSTTATAEEKKPEKSTFDVKLEKYDAASKIKIIKEVRAITSLGLKEAKDFVEKVPAVLKKGVSKEEADQIIEKLKAVGATVMME